MTTTDRKLTVDTDHEPDAQTRPGELFYSCRTCGGPLRMGDGLAALATGCPSGALGMDPRPWLHDLKSDYYWGSRPDRSTPRAPSNPAAYSISPGVTRCGIHGDPIKAGRCATCDCTCGGGDLPAFDHHRDCLRAQPGYDD